MSDGLAVSNEAFIPFEDRRIWQVALNLIAAMLISFVFLAAGLWKITDPTGAAARLAQARVPESLSMATAVVLGILETFTGVLLLAPRFRRWGAWLGTLLLLAFMIFIGAHYTELRGVDCSCFPWVKRVVGPGFFAGDGAFILLTLSAGIWAPASRGVRPAGVIFGAIVVFALMSYGFAAVRHMGVKAPATITAEDGKPISLEQGKVFIYFFNPQCLHCLAAGRRLAALHWGATRFMASRPKILNSGIGSWARPDWPIRVP